MVKKEFPQDSNNQEKFTLSRSGTGIGGLDEILEGGLPSNHVYLIEGDKSMIEALKNLAQAVPDVLISDIGMPEADGYELIKTVRRLSPERSGNVPAVALTAYARAEDKMRALRSGFQMHVSKPVEIEELVTFVANIAGRNQIVS